MSKLGWGMPAGASSDPYWDNLDPSCSDLVEDILQLLEDAGVPTGINDQITKLIEDWEGTLDDCSECPEDVEAVDPASLVAPKEES